jgi:hypothetical protein
MVTTSLKHICLAPTRFRFRRADAFRNRLRNNDTVATDEFIVRFSGHAVLGVDIGNCDIA